MHPIHRELSQIVAEIIECIPAENAELKKWYENTLECDQNIFHCFQHGMLTERQFYSFRKAIFLEMKYKLIGFNETVSESGSAHWKFRIMAILRKHKMLN